MQKNNPNAFSENDLNNLLNKSFLESHLTKPKYEKMTEVIAAHVLGVKPTAIPTRQSFIKKLVGRISLQVFLLFSIVLAGGITEIAFLNNNSEEPKKINISNSSEYKQTHEVKGINKDVQEKNTPTRDNLEIFHKETPKQFSMENNSSTQPLTQNNITENNLSKNEKHTIEDQISTQVTDSVSISNNLVIQKPEPIYFDYLKKGGDSISENSVAIENKNTKANTTKNRKTNFLAHSAKHPKNKKVYRGRSNAKEKNKNKTERDRSGKNFKGI